MKKIDEMKHYKIHLFEYITLAFTQHHFNFFPVFHSFSNNIMCIEFYQRQNFLYIATYFSKAVLKLYYSFQHHRLVCQGMAMPHVSHQALHASWCVPRWRGRSVSCISCTLCFCSSTASGGVYSYSRTCHHLLPQKVCHNSHRTEIVYIRFIVNISILISFGGYQYAVCT